MGRASTLRGRQPGGSADALGAVTADAVLCLAAGLPLPPRDLLDRLLAGPADVWHGGLRLGLEGQPVVLDHVAPLWMLNAPLDPDVEATSWRLSLRAALVRRGVLDQLGGPDAGFASLTGAGLDLGMRWIRAGALVRHVPDLVPTGATTADPAPTTADGLRLVGRHHGRTWAGWALQRAVVAREVGPLGAARLVGEVRRTGRAPLPTYRAEARPQGSTDRRITVVLPTVDRYPTLVPLLGQLATQTVRPHEVLIVDQTDPARRRHDLTEVAPDLPVEVIGLDRPGQSTARNAALQRATGDVALFIDDDDEVPSTLLADHLRLLADGIDAVCGAVDDATAGPPPPGFRHRRASDVFPTNNATVRMSALARSGLFDPAYDHGPRADHDLGMRLHLSGAVLVYDPSVEVRHLHAPSGGLRTHGARKVTRASARRSLTERHLPAVTQLYLGPRYYGERQQHEARAITLLSTLSGDGSHAADACCAAVVQAVRLPSSRRAVRATEVEAEALRRSTSAHPHPPRRPPPRPTRGRMTPDPDAASAPSSPSTRARRVLVAASELPPGPGGIGAHAHAVAVELHRQGRDVTLVGCQHYADGSSRAAFAAASPVPITRLPDRAGPLRTALARARVLRRAVADTRPDVVVASGGRVLWLAAPVARAARVPMVAVVHGTELGGRGWARVLTRRALQQATAVVAVSDFTAGLTTALGVTRPITVVPNGADADRFGADPARRDRFRRRPRAGRPAGRAHRGQRHRAQGPARRGRGPPGAGRGGARRGLRGRGPPHRGHRPGGPGPTARGGRPPARPRPARRGRGRRRPRGRRRLRHDQHLHRLGRRRGLRHRGRRGGPVRRARGRQPRHRCGGGRPPRRHRAGRRPPSRGPWPTR